MNFLTRNTWLLIVILAASTPPAVAGSAEVGGRLGWHGFQWDEFESDGAKFLEEEGVRLTAGAFGGNTMTRSTGFIWDARGDLYFGEADYDGQTQMGIPVRSDTWYFGITVEGQVGVRVGELENGFAWDFTGTVGHDAWIREIDDTATLGGFPVSGVEEIYFVTFVRAGTGPVWRVERWTGRIQAGLKYPVLTIEYLDEDESGLDDDETLYPEGRVSGYARWSNDVRLTRRLHLRVDVYYDSYRFDRSDPEYASILGDPVIVVQPESDQDTVGFEAGVAVRF